MYSEDYSDDGRPGEENLKGESLIKGEIISQKESVEAYGCVSIELEKDIPLVVAGNDVQETRSAGEFLSDYMTQGKEEEENNSLNQEDTTEEYSSPNRTWEAQLYTGQEAEEQFNKYRRGNEDKDEEAGKEISRTLESLIEMLKGLFDSGEVISGTVAE